MNLKNSGYLNIKKTYLRFLKKKEVASKPIIDKVGKLNTFYLPLSEWIYIAYKKDNKTKIIGLSGGQGSGKSTITGILKFILKKEYGLDLNTKTSQLNRDLHIDDDTEAARGEKICMELVVIIEKKMFQAADLDNLTGAKRLKSIRAGISNARDRVIFLSNRMRSRAENDDYSGAASDLLEVKKQFGLCCKIVIESGITANDVDLLKLVTKLKHLSIMP